MENFCRARVPLFNEKQSPPAIKTEMSDITINLRAVVEIFREINCTDHDTGPQFDRPKI